MKKTSRALLDWYRQNARDYFFRINPHPYTTWVSEIMLQQTRMPVVLPKLVAFTERFTTVADLAAADESEVLNAWQGLGYYSRARNLHKAAKQIVDGYGDNWPETEDQWLELAGIGPYTAAAVSSIAFGKDAIVVDGNVRRIYSRLFCATNLNDKEVKDGLKAYYQDGRYGDTNQALMDLGRFICLPKNPKCSECPLQADCSAAKHGRWADFPPAKPKPAKIVLEMTFHLIYHEHNILLVEHTGEAFLKKQLFPPYTTELKSPAKNKTRYSFRPPLLDMLLAANRFDLQAPDFNHSITNHDIRCRLSGYRVTGDTAGRLADVSPTTVWTPLEQITEHMVSSLAGKISKALNSTGGQAGLFSD